MSLPTVAVLGTGTMGAGMARTIAAAGLPVRVWNRTAARAEPLGDVATVAGSIREAVKGADIVLTMLYDGASVASAMTEAGPALGAGTVWLQQSTVGVAGTDRLVALADELGVAYVDAPVLGTRKPAEDGSLVVLASGAEDLRARVAPVLDAIGSRTMWVGDAGAGTRLKLAANAWVLTVVEGVAESLALTRDLGLDPRLFLEAVAGGALDAPYVGLKGAAMIEGSFDPAFALNGALKDADLILEAVAGGALNAPYVGLKGAAMIEGSFDPAFALNGALKDADLILEAAAGAGVEMGLMPGIRDHLSRAAAAGHGDLDMAATYLEHRSEE